jgi:hypothetical protein
VKLLQLSYELRLHHSPSSALLDRLNDRRRVLFRRMLLSYSHELMDWSYLCRVYPPAIEASNMKCLHLEIRV